MANKFETATNNYGNNFSNNNGIHMYVTKGHNYNDSSYVLAKFNGQVDPLSITSTLNGYPPNNVTCYSQGYDVTVKEHSHVDDYTQTITLGWPSNINTKGKIEGTLTFSVDETSVSANGGIVNIHFPDLKYTATRDTRGYRYAKVTLYPDVPSSPDDLDDDGTESPNATAYETTYASENRQGFFNYPEPYLDYILYSSYGNKGDHPFMLVADTNIYNGTGSIGYVDDVESYACIFSRYTHIYDNMNTVYSYAYAPYDDTAKWSYTNVRLEVDKNYLSTFPKLLTISYDSSYWNISYDGTDELEMSAAFVYNGTYGGVTSSSPTDTNLTSYERSTLLYDKFPDSIANSSTTPSYLRTSYTITQEGATIKVSYFWGSIKLNGATNLDDEGKEYVKFANETDPSTKVIVSPQNHHMGSVSGDLDFSFAKEATNRKVYVDQGTVTYGTFGNLKWEDCENGKERYFNASISASFTNYKEQNIKSITNEYDDAGGGTYNNKKPRVSLKCRQLPANWSHPALRTNIRIDRAYIPRDDRFRSVNPSIFVETNANMFTIDYDPSLYWKNVDWSTSTHIWNDISRITEDNSKLKTWIEMPSISSPYVKSTINGTLEYEDITIGYNGGIAYIRPTGSFTALSYTLGYDKGYEEARWNVHSYSLEGMPYSDSLDEFTDPIGMSYEDVEQFEDFEIVLPAKENYNYRYPYLSIQGILSDKSYFSFNGSDSSTSLLGGSDWTTASKYDKLGLQIKVEQNLKTGKDWYAEVANEPSNYASGILHVSPGTLRNKAPRSALIKFTYSVNDYLTTCNINLMNKTINCLQSGDRWDRFEDGFIANLTIWHGDYGGALDIDEVDLEEIRMEIIEDNDDPTNTQEYVPEEIYIGPLVEAHQLLVTGIGTLASRNYTIEADEAYVDAIFTGTPKIEDAKSYTYESYVSVSCESYKLYNVTKGPNGTDDMQLHYVVDPISANYVVMFSNPTTQKFSDCNRIYIGKNQGQTTYSSCEVMDGIDFNKINLGVFHYTPEKFTGAQARQRVFKVGVKNASDQKVSYSTNYYTITQHGVTPSVTSHEYTFLTIGNRCATSVPDPVSGTEELTYVGAFDVTPDTDPFKNCLSYTNGMVSGSFDNSNYREGLTKDASLSPTHTTYDVPYGTDINFRFGLSGSSSDYITWSRSGYIRYKFYYCYRIECLDEEDDIISYASSGDLTSNTVTSYPDANATNYYKRRLDNGSWSSTLTIPVTSTGDYSVTGSFVNGSTEYSTSKRRTYTLTVRTYTDSQEYQYQIPAGTGKMSLAFTDINGNTITSPVVLESAATTNYRVDVVYPKVYLQLRERTKRTYNTGETEYITDWTSWNNTNILAFSLTPTPPNHTFTVSSGTSESYVFYLVPLEKYNGLEVIGNGAYGDSVKFTVRMKGIDYVQYSVTSIGLTSSTPYTTYDKSLTVTPTFTYVIRKRTYDGDGNLKEDMTNWTGHCPYSPSLNETSHTFSNMTFDKEYTFTFTVSLPDGLRNETGSSLPTHTVKVTRLSNDTSEYRVTSISLSSDTPYTTYNASFTVTPKFNYTIQKRVLDGDNNVKSDWSAYDYPNGVRLNETSHTFTGLVVNVPQEFTFTTSTANDVTNATGSSLPTHVVKVTRIPDTIYRTVYKYTGSVSVTMTNQILTAFDTDKKQTANATWTCTYWKRTDSRPSSSSTYTEGTWTRIDNNNNYGSINSSTYTFSNVPLGSSASTYGVASYTFTVTPPSNPNGLNDGTFTYTAFAYMYGKTYYNA